VILARKTWYITCRNHLERWKVLSCETYATKKENEKAKRVCEQKKFVSPLWLVWIQQKKHKSAFRQTGKRITHSVLPWYPALRTARVRHSPYNTPRTQQTKAQLCSWACVRVQGESDGDCRTQPPMCPEGPSATFICQGVWTLQVWIERGEKLALGDMHGNAISFFVLTFHITDVSAIRAKTKMLPY